MKAEGILAAHVMFGLVGVLAATWALVELLNANKRNHRRVFIAGLATVVFIWLSFISGGYWYVSFYSADKTVVLAGSRPWAHSVFMEAKEHLFLTLLLLATYLPVVVRGQTITGDKSLRMLAIATAGLIVLLGLAMEHSGLIVSLAVRMGATP